MKISVHRLFQAPGELPRERPTHAEAVEQKYDRGGGTGVRTSQLSAQSIRARRSRIGCAKAPQPPWFRHPWTHASQSVSIFSLIVCDHHTQTYDQLILGCTQLSFTSRPYFRAGLDLYRRYAGFSPASQESAMVSQSKHWSGSDRPAPPPLLESYWLRMLDAVVGHSIVNF